MKLTVWLPSEILFEEQVERIKAEAENGWFGLLPRHIDFVTALVPGVMTFQPAGKPEEYLAIDHGILVKCGADVSVSSTREKSAKKRRAPMKQSWRRTWSGI
jgi:F-type H+-transporting ATPase subunit epsilon